MGPGQHPQWGGERREGGSGESGGHGVGGPVGGGPGGERSLVVANMSRFFFSSSPDPHFICFQFCVGFSRSCVGVLGVFISKDPEVVGVSHGVQRAQMCVFFASERGSVLLEV